MHILTILPHQGQQYDFHGWKLIMVPIRRSWTLSSILLAAAGVSLAIMGLYFILVRPPLLPEDIRFLALPAAQLDAVKPQLELWLAHVFKVMGGYIIATGVLMIALAVTSFRARCPGAAIGATVGGAVSIGWMAYVNFVIASDFKWVLLAMALLWASSLVAFRFEKNSVGPDDLADRALSTDRV